LDVSYFTGVQLQRKSFKNVDSPGVVICLHSRALSASGQTEMMRKKASKNLAK